MKLKMKRAGGFTLVELLVVIAIIAVLAALSTPVAIKMVQKAKIVKATGVCTGFEMAVENFESEYNYLPYSGTSVPKSNSILYRSDDDLVTVLAGKNSTINFKEIRFFELNEPKGSTVANYKDGMHVTDGSADLYDPWGNTYYIYMDYELTGKFDNPFVTGEQINGKKCIIFSTGTDGEIGKDEIAKSKDNPSNFK